jgi:hypothetical protein
MQRDLQHGVVLPARGQLLDRGDAMQSSARRRQLCVCVCGVLRLGWHGPEIKKDLSPSLNYADQTQKQTPHRLTVLVPPVRRPDNVMAREIPSAGCVCARAVGRHIAVASSSRRPS